MQVVLRIIFVLFAHLFLEIYFSSVNYRFASYVASEKKIISFSLRCKHCFSQAAATHVVIRLQTHKSTYIYTAFEVVTF